VTLRLGEEVVAVSRSYPHKRGAAPAHERHRDLGPGGSGPPDRAEQVGQVSDRVPRDLKDNIAKPYTGAMRRLGRFGPLGTLETPEGLLTFPLHAALLERLRLVREGAEVLIRYTGKQTSKAGRIFKAFEVFVAGEDALRDTPGRSLRLAVADGS